MSIDSKLKFRFLPDIATADLAFEAFGKNYNELFENAATALESALVDLKSLDPSIPKKIKIEKESVESLLTAFLEELVFLKDAEQLLFNKLKCKIVNVASGKWRVESDLIGEKIDRQKHKFGVDVKAVTKHLFKIERLHNKSLRCQVILDV